MINNKSDFSVYIILMISLVTLYYLMSAHSTIFTLYFLSLAWYFTTMYKIAKVRWFSGVGLYIIYLFAYVQAGVLFNKYYSYYTTFNEKTIIIILIYNILSPFILILLKPYCSYEKSNIKQSAIQDNWLWVLFFCGVLAMFSYYFSVGSIPLFASDAENFRVQAISGRGFLVIIANNCFLISMSMSRNKKQMLFSLIVGGILLAGTGYRSQLLILIIVFFLVDIVGRGKRYIFLGFIVLTIIFSLYAFIGLYRSATEYNSMRIYMPVLWRFFVNTDNFNILVNKYPTSNLQHGYSIINDLLVLLPGSQQTFMYQLKQIIGYNFAGGSMTPSVFGEGYYNWGILGAIIWPMFNLVFISFIDKYNKKKIPGGLYYAVSFGLTNLATSSFIPPLINNYLPALIVLFFIKRLNNRYRLKLF